MEASESVSTRGAVTTRVSFATLFQELPGGYVTPNVPLRADGTPLIPGVAYEAAGLTVGRLPLLSFRGGELRVRHIGDLVVLY